jgi:hypothetical protein
VQGDERRSRRVAVLLVPDGDAVDLLMGHAIPTLEAPQIHRPTVVGGASNRGADG